MEDKKYMVIDTKKEQEREELHRAIWAIADDLRGAVDGWTLRILMCLLKTSDRVGLRDDQVLWLTKA